MRSKSFFLLPGFTLMLATVAQANLAFVLTPAARSGVGSNEVFFAATMTNANPTTNLYLNDLQLSFTNAATNYLAADTNVFFANVPGILLTNETYTDIVFGVSINPSTPRGNYSGTVSILGGANIFATNNLASQTFQISLVPAVLHLAIARTNCVISWPSPPAGFVLQACSNLSTTNWVALTNTPTVSNGWNEVIFPPGGGSCFYRLAYP
ncbi:MAG TPA: hypothetical protein VGI63_04995 [Verrucomicrobiae bacterium]|jgi:hypothetical protein